MTTAAIALAACSSAATRPTQTPVSTLELFNNGVLTTPTPQPTIVASPSIPDSPMTTFAMATDRTAKRSSGTPVGAVVFGSDYTTTGTNVSIVAQKITFTAGQPIAWRVVLPTAVGGESVRVTVTTADGTETLVDEFTAQAAWNIYYGKALLSVEPGTYVLHYFVDGHEVGSGTFKLKLAPTPTPTPTPTPSPSRKS